MAKRRRVSKLPTNLASLNLAQLRKVSSSIKLPLTAKDNKASIIVKIQTQERMKKKMKEFCSTPKGKATVPAPPGKRRREAEDDGDLGTRARSLKQLGGRRSSKSRHERQDSQRQTHGREANKQDQLPY